MTPIPRPSHKPVDWRRLILDLRRHGWNVQRIAAYVGRTRTAVCRWCNDGCHPRYEEGAALLELHRLVTEAAAREEKKAA
ncbi:MAG: helix-turn-helix domain-containing protein [Pseudomonadota bacterium]